MKKSIVVICTLILFFSIIVFAQVNSAINPESSTYNPGTKEVTFHAVKGWNFAPFSLSSQTNEDTTIENRCRVDYVLATFLWDSTEAKYFGWADASDMQSPTGQQLGGRNGPYESWSMYYDKYLQLVNLAQQGNAFASNGAAFAYVTQPCDIKLRFENTNPGKKLSKNANFIHIASWMVGQSPKSIFSNCIIEKINTWSNQRQAWALSAEEMDSKAKEFQNDETPISEELLGTPFIIYVNDDCEMQGIPYGNDAI